MSKTHYRLLALILPLALVGLIAFAPGVLAKKHKKKNAPPAETTSAYQPPTLQLTAAPAVVTACTGDAAKVQLDAKATFQSGAELHYKWSATGGQITGNGASPTWDLAGVQAGTYKAYVEVDNGTTEACTIFSSAAVVVNCAPPPPLVCPNITISCPDKLTANQPVTFTASASGGSSSVAPAYEWAVSAGKITSGQGTNSIVVDTTGISGQSVQATLTMPGYGSLSCAATCTVQMPPPEIVCRKFDEFGAIARNDEKARLDNLGIELQNDPTSSAYVVVHPGPRSRRSDVQQQITRAEDYLVNSRKIDKSRIITSVGAPSSELGVEIWVCPQGAKSPISVAAP